MRVLNGFRTGETGRSDDEPVNLTVILSFLCVCVCVAYLPSLRCRKTLDKRDGAKGSIIYFFGRLRFHTRQSSACVPDKKKTKERKGKMWRRVGLVLTTSSCGCVVLKARYYSGTEYTELKTSYILTYCKASFKRV